jgi:subtilase family serine protease
MRLHSLVTCASVFCALTTAGFSQLNNSHQIARPQVLGAADPSASTHFSIYFPLTNKAELEQLVTDQTNSSSPNFHKWLTPAEFKAKFGPKPAEIAKVKRRLESAGFTVTAEHTQSIEVEGSVGAVEKLFATQLQQVQMPKGNLRFAAAHHRLTLPAELASAGAVIPEFNPHLAAHVHSEHLDVAGSTVALRNGAGSVDQRLSSADSFFYPNDMNEAYDFPSFTTSVVPKSQAPSGPPVQLAGLGATMGIVISSTVLQSDINRAFNSTVSAGSASDVNNYSGNTSLPVPAVIIDPVLGGSGSFKANTDDAAEASLDTQMSLGTAPGAHEIVYDMPDLSDASIIAAYTQVDEENRVDVVSSSFGECELDFTAAYNGGVDFTGILLAFHDLFLQGNSQGITFLASSGDNGAVPCVSADFSNNPANGTNFVLGVENPASDPNVTAVGGTNLKVSATPTANDSTYNSENANFDPRLPAQFTANGSTFTVGNNTWGSGGGYSAVFVKPTYQQVVNTGTNPNRAVPDVSLQMGGCPGDADLTAQDCTALPRSASIVFIGGVPNLLIGTSSSSPQLAGVVALNVELAGTRLGNINPQIYALAALQSAASGKTASLSQFFHRNISGNNNGYTVTPGQAYSTVLGTGTLFVKNFLQLQSAPAAGTPNTPSNP